MQPQTSDIEATKAEIGFENFPCAPCAVEADRLLKSLEGVIQTLFNPSVQRVAVLFDPKRVNIPRILSTFELHGLKPRVISVASPAVATV